MEERIYHGNASPEDFARELVAAFNRGNLRAQQIGSGNQIAVQIGTSQVATSGGKTALTVSIRAVEDGIAIKIGQQTWLSVAASLGYTALLALRNPFALLGRVDDLAQDIENLGLSEEVWKVIESTVRSSKMSTELSERLRRIVCNYCNSANPVGESRCLACGAPLGDNQPLTCRKCGFIISPGEVTCPNCKQPV